MKSLKFILFMTILLASDYALAQLFNCDCNEQDLSSGITGEDIFNTLCPDGELGPGFTSAVANNSIVISGDGLSYSVIIPPDETPFCQISQEGVGKAGRKLTEETLAVCEAQLIEGCNLKRFSAIPAISQWGVITMAGILGIAGFIVMRRRKAAA